MSIKSRVERLERMNEPDDEPLPLVILHPDETRYFVAGNTVFAERGEDESQEDFIARARAEAMAVGRRTGVLPCLLGYQEYPMPEGQE